MQFCSLPTFYVSFMVSIKVNCYIMWLTVHIMVLHIEKPFLTNNRTNKSIQHRKHRGVNWWWMSASRGIDANEYLFVFLRLSLVKFNFIVKSNRFLSVLPFINEKENSDDCVTKTDRLLKGIFYTKEEVTGYFCLRRSRYMLTIKQMRISDTRYVRYAKNF